MHNKDENLLKVIEAHDLENVIKVKIIGIKSLFLKIYFRIAHLRKTPKRSSIKFEGCITRERTLYNKRQSCRKKCWVS